MAFIEMDFASGGGSTPTHYTGVSSVIKGNFTADKDYSTFILFGYASSPTTVKFTHNTKDIYGINNSPDVANSGAWLISDVKKGDTISAPAARFQWYYLTTD